MGRAFEFRKERKFKRWGHMAKTFTKIGKEITIAVKQGGPDVTGNPRLRALMQTARSENMPKENIERAIKRASEKDQADYKEIVLEGRAAHGIAVLVEAATDNNNRTVANVRSYFTKFGGSLGTSGSVEYLFDHKSMFRIKDNGKIDLEELELELIDLGVDEVFEEENEDEEKEIVIYGEYTAFNAIQKYIEDHGYEMISAEFTRIPNGELVDVDPEARVEINKLIEKIEEDDDVQSVYHNMSPGEDYNIGGLLRYSGACKSSQPKGCCGLGAPETLYPILYSNLPIKRTPHKLCQTAFHCFQILTTERLLRFESP